MGAASYLVIARAESARQLLQDAICHERTEFAVFLALAIRYASGRTPHIVADRGIAFDPGLLGDVPNVEAVPTADAWLLVGPARVAFFAL
ncbi:MAG: hypothetical protein MUF54_13565 [Polyangiaceae bacterium]|jgi:hypothetical protein|nr:hypothetical protein [Polyangiaceae bacterium]